jgi:hypothetical protein
MISRDSREWPKQDYGPFILNQCQDVGLKLMYTECEKAYCSGSALNVRKHKNANLFRAMSSILQFEDQIPTILYRTCAHI